MAITTINENDYIKDSREVINSNFTELNTLKAPLASPAFTGTPTAPTPSPGDDSAKLATTEYVQEEIRTHANLPVGFEYFSPNPNIPQGSLPLFGGEYSRDTYSALWDWVQTQTGYLITDTAWQALSNSQNGNVPFYSDGDGSTTFRVPSLKCWVRGANGTVSEVGSYLAAGLPNITGSFDLLYGTNNYSIIRATAGAFSSPPSALYENSAFLQTGSSSTNVRYHQPLDASKSNAIYGNSNTVQPESIVGLWLVKAYGVIVDTGTIDEQAYIDDRMNAMTQYVNDSVGAINTRLGTILEASGSFTAGGSIVDICSITTHPAGTYLIVGHTSNSVSATSTFVNYLYAGVTHLGSCVSPGENGGWGNNVKIVMLQENEVVVLKGFKASGVGGTFSGNLRMVRLA